VVKKNKMNTTRVSAIALLTILVPALCARADDFSLPPWQRGDAGTTFQAWSFSTSAKDNVTADAGFIKPEGAYDPYLYVNSSYSYNSSAGAWPLGELDIFVADFADTSPGTSKQIQIQLTWQGASNNYMPPQPSVNVVPEFNGDPSAFPITDISWQNFEPVNGWNRSLFVFIIEPNPTEEWITIKGDIIVDQVIVDTICVPEPASLVLLFGGALMAFKKRKSVKV